VTPHDWRPRRSLFYIREELPRMRHARLFQLEQGIRPMPAEQYAATAVELMAEAIDQDPIPVPTDWAALALDSEPRLEER
jgi:hypothetical protein